MTRLQLPHHEGGPLTHFPKFSILKAFSMSEAGPGELGTGMGARSGWLILLQQHPLHPRSEPSGLWASPGTPLGGCSPVMVRPGPGAPTEWSPLGCASSRSLRCPGPSSIQPAGRNPSRRRWGSKRNPPDWGGVLVRVYLPNKRIVGAMPSPLPRASGGEGAREGLQRKIPASTYSLKSGVTAWGGHQQGM